MDKSVKNWLATYVLAFAVLNVVALLAGAMGWGPTAPAALFAADAALFVPVCVPLAIGRGVDAGRMLASLSLATGIYAAAVVVFALAATFLELSIGVIAAVDLVVVFAFVLVLRALAVVAGHIDQVRGSASEPRRPGTL